MNILSNREDSEEAINDTYLKAWNTIPPSKPNPLKTYLGMLTRRISLNRYEYYRAQKRNLYFETILSEVEQMLPSSSVTDSDEGEITRAVNEFLKGLKKENRIFFVRRYWHSDSLEDIAKLCGCSESKVKSSLFRTRKALRKYLEKEGIAL